jgi:hypothetical protein
MDLPGLEESKIGAQLPVLLAPPRAGLDDGDGIPLRAAVERDDPQHREAGDLRDLLLVADAGIDDAAEHDEGRGGDEAGEQACEQQEWDVG